MKTRLKEKKEGKMNKMSKRTTLFIVMVLSLSILKVHATINQPYKFDVEKNQNNPANKPDISIMIADLKYNKETIKILEFGEGTKSCFKGYNKLYGTGKIWEQFWHKLHEYGLPIWYVGRPPTSKEQQKTIAYQTLIRKGGMFCANLVELQNHRIFKALKHKAIRNTGQAISDYNGIIIFKRYRGQKEQIQSFKKKHPNFIFIDQAVKPFVNNKYTTSQVFQKTNLNSFRPAWKVYPKQYSSTLAKKIINDLGSQTIVIKPLNSANGWGVIIVTYDQLDEILDLIINRPHILSNNPDRTFKHWSRDQNKNFLVERYEPSNIITIEGKDYDPTMRVVFTLEYNNQEVSVTWLGSYWKLPAISLSEEGTLTKKHKSKINNERTSSTIVDPHDYSTVKTHFEQIMPTLYTHMLNAREPE